MITIMVNPDVANDKDRTFAKVLTNQNYMNIKSTFLFILGLFGLLISCESGGNIKSDNDVATNKSNIVIKGQSKVEDGVSAQNILQIAMSSEAHTTLVAGVQATGLEDVLANNGPLTVFAPTNPAFDKLSEGTLENLLKPENLQTLKTIILYHAAPGTYKKSLLKDGQKLYMATGDYLHVERRGDEVFVNGSKILTTFEGTNGIIHVIDDVFLPVKK